MRFTPKQIKFKLHIIHDKLVHHRGESKIMGLGEEVGGGLTILRDDVTSSVREGQCPLKNQPALTQCINFLLFRMQPLLFVNAPPPHLWSLVRCKQGYCMACYRLCIKIQTSIIIAYAFLTKYRITKCLVLNNIFPQIIVYWKQPILTLHRMNRFVQQSSFHQLRLVMAMNYDVPINL